MLLTAAAIKQSLEIPTTSSVSMPNEGPISIPLILLLEEVLPLDCTLASDGATSVLL